MFTRALPRDLLVHLPTDFFHDRRGYVPDLLIRVPPLDSAEPSDDLFELKTLNTIEHYTRQDSPAARTDATRAVERRASTVLTEIDS